MLPTRIAHCPAPGDEEAVRLAHEVAGLLESAGHFLPGPAQLPEYGGRATPGKLVGIARALEEYELVVSYGRGARNIALAHAVFAAAMGLPPLVHVDFGESAGEGGLVERTLARLAFGSAAAFVCPHDPARAHAIAALQLPAERVHAVPPVLDVEAYRRKPQADALPDLVKRGKELWLGADIAGCAHADIDALVAALAELPVEWHLVVPQDAKANARLRAAAERCDVAHRVHQPAMPAEPSALFALFDLFVLPARGRSALLPVQQAVAAGKAVVLAKGDARGGLVSQENRAALDGDIRTVIARLANDRVHRGDIGNSNAAHAAAEFSPAAVSARFRAIVEEVCARAQMPG